MASGPYVIPGFHFTAAAVATNTTPIGAYRVAGRPEATALLERGLDMLAAELGMDPVESPAGDLLPPTAFPYEKRRRRPSTTRVSMRWPWTRRSVLPGTAICGASSGPVASGATACSSASASPSTSR